MGFEFLSSASKPVTKDLSVASYEFFKNDLLLQVTQSVSAEMKAGFRCLTLVGKRLRCRLGTETFSSQVIPQSASVLNQRGSVRVELEKLADQVKFETVRSVSPHGAMTFADAVYSESGWGVVFCYLIPPPATPLNSPVPPLTIVISQPRKELGTFIK